MTDIDHTVIVNGGLPKSWKCPHCGKRQTFTKQDDETFIRYMKFIRHCDRCCYLHSWELKMTEDFKKAIVKILLMDGEQDG